jgi:pimeloyl-ACP methyl ester carboxylesterase
VARRTLLIRLAAAVVLTAIAVVVGLVAYEQIAEAYWARVARPHGRLVDIGGYRLHIDCEGEGSPTVILEAGLGDVALNWSDVQPALAKSVRVCSYDRGGFGWSDASPYPRDPLHETSELHTLLENAEIAPPYVLVGHSYGADLTRLYASRYARQVVGLVLVEASNQDQWGRMPALDSVWTGLRSACPLIGWRARFGLLRLAHDSQPAYSKTVRPIVESFTYTPKESKATCGEEEAIMGSGRRELAPVRSLGDLPIGIVSADQNFFGSLGGGQVWTTWQALQTEDTHLSSRTTRVFASHSGHEVEHDDPATVIVEVERMLKAIRDFPSA